MNVVASTKGALASPSVGQFITLLPLRMLTSAPRLRLPVCVRACVRGRSAATVGGGWNNVASY